MTAVELNPNQHRDEKRADGQLDFAPLGAKNPNTFRPLNIALLGYRSHPYVGGQGIYIKYLSRALKEIGHKVDVYSGPPYPELDSGINLIKVPSLDLYSVDNHVTALRWSHLKSFTDTYEWWEMLSGGFGEPYTFGRRVVKALKNKHYDIIHDNQSLCYGLLTLQKQNNVVATIHHPIHRDRELAIEAAKDKLHKSLAKRWYSFLKMQEKVADQLDNVITVSKVSQKDIGHYFNRPYSRTTVIPNGIDTNTFSPNKDIAKSAYRLITTASADQPLKGLKFLLEAVAKLKVDFPELTLEIIGKLKKNGDTEKLLNKLDLESSVIFSSGISTEELVAKYNEASIAVSPSLYEGFGLPAAEAMACGLAVVSSDGGALPEVVGDAGIIVPAGDEQSLEKAIRQLLQNPEKIKQMGMKARKRVVDTFSWNTVAHQLSQYYYSILDKN